MAGKNDTDKKKPAKKGKIQKEDIADNEIKKSDKNANISNEASKKRKSEKVFDEEDVNPNEGDEKAKSLKVSGSMESAAAGAPTGDDQALTLEGEEGENGDKKLSRPLKWHPDEIHCSQLCDNCLQINLRWPPRPRITPPPDKDPNLIYPGDVDPFFQPSRGDILIVHPKGFGLDPKPSSDDLWWKSKRIGGGFCVSYDGDKRLKFDVGDMVLRIGAYLDDQEEELEQPTADIDPRRASEISTKQGRAEKANSKDNADAKRGSQIGTKQDKTEKVRNKNVNEGPKEAKVKQASILKPRKIADPPELDPMTYQPYQQVELYICSGSVIEKEDEPLDVDELEEELKRVFEAHTRYKFRLERGLGGNNDHECQDGPVKTISIPEDKSIRRILTLKENSINNTKLNEKRSNFSKDVPKPDPSTILDMSPSDTSENDTNSRDQETGAVERKRSLRTVALEASQASQRKNEQLSNIDLCLDQKSSSTSTATPKTKVRLIWTFLGSQAQLPLDESSMLKSSLSPNCPGLDCFYQPYLNLGSSCRMNHFPTPNLGEILIHERAWLSDFNHRKNEWRSLVQWVVPPLEPTAESAENVSNSIEDEQQQQEQEIKSYEKEARKKSKQGVSETATKDNADEEKRGKGKGDANRENKIENKIYGQKDKGLIANGIPKDLGKAASVDDQKSKRLTSYSMQKGLQLDQNDMQDVEQAFQNLGLTNQGKALNAEAIETSRLSNELKEALNEGMVLIRPFVGRQLEEVQPPVEEWKWPRKKKVWGHVEMYMREWGGEGLGWKYWGSSDGICDTKHPCMPPEAKPKFLHLLDKNIEVPSINSSIGHEVENRSNLEDSPPLKGSKEGEKKKSVPEVSTNHDSKNKNNNKRRKI